MLITALYSEDEFTSKIVKTISLDNFNNAFMKELPYKVAFRTIKIAALVTIIDVVISFIVSFFITFVVKEKYQKYLIASIVLPLWASYIVKQYAWRQILDGTSGYLKTLTGQSPGYGYVAIVIVMAYLWLPFVLIPIYSGMSKVPKNLLEASGDLGAKNFRTTLKIITPLIKPSIVAGSIFSFGLTLGDYFASTLVGGSKVQVLGQLIQTTFASGQETYAAALTFFPIIIMFAYLAIAKRSGALGEL